MEPSILLLPAYSSNPVPLPTPKIVPCFCTLLACKMYTDYTQIWTHLSSPVLLKPTSIFSHKPVHYFEYNPSHSSSNSSVTCSCCPYQIFKPKLVLNQSLTTAIIVPYNPQFYHTAPIFFFLNILLNQPPFFHPAALIQHPFETNRPIYRTHPSFFSAPFSPHACP